MNERRRPGQVVGLTALVPLAWAVLLLFHPAPDPNDIFGSLRQEATAMLAVHLGSLLFIGLTGAVLYLLVRDLHGPLATLARAVLAAAAAYRQVGAPLSASILLALSAITVLHAPPTGPLGLLLLAGAVLLLARGRRPSVVAETAQPGG